MIQKHLPKPARIGLPVLVLLLALSVLAAPAAAADDTPEPELEVARPRGYLVLPGWPQLEDLLAAHGLRAIRTRAPVRIDDFGRQGELVNGVVG